MASPRRASSIESEEKILKLAVLIDADNAKAAVIEGLMFKTSGFGSEYNVSFKYNF